MRLVVASDIHADWVTDGFDRHADLESVLPLLHETCLEVPNTKFLCLGDISNPFSRNVHTAIAIMLGFAGQLGRDGVENFWVVGNHDVYEDSQGSSCLQAFGRLGPSTHLLSRPDCIWIGDRTLVTLPYTPTSHTYDPAAHIESAWNSCGKPSAEGSSKCIVAGHLNIEGITPGSETEDMKRGRDVFWPMAAVQQYFPRALWLNGHYHERQVFRGIHIPGELMRLTHGEEDLTPAFSVFDL